jgi:hypothetical protein
LVALPRTRNETAFEAHLAPNILGDLRFRTSAEFVSI